MEFGILPALIYWLDSASCKETVGDKRRYEVFFAVFILINTIYGKLVLDLHDVPGAADPPLWGVGQQICLTAVKMFFNKYGLKHTIILLDETLLCTLQSCTFCKLVFLFEAFHRTLLYHMVQFNTCSVPCEVAKQLFWVGE